MKKALELYNIYHTKKKKLSPSSWKR